MLLFKNDLIRCIDCIHKQADEEGGDLIFCDLHKIYTEYEDFCSRGVMIIKNSRMKRDGVK